MAPTLLAVLVRQRQLTQEEMIDVLRRRAREMEIPDNRFDVSVRQLQRWIAGHVRQPHPVQCRVLEAEFRHSIEDLLATPLAASGAAGRIRISDLAGGGEGSRVDRRRTTSARPWGSPRKITQAEECRSS